MLWIAHFFRRIINQIGSLTDPDQADYARSSASALGPGKCEGHDITPIEVSDFGTESSDSYCIKFGLL